MIVAALGELGALASTTDLLKVETTGSDAMALLAPWQEQAIQTAVILAAAFLLRWFVIRTLRTRVEDARLRYRLRGLSTYVLIAIALLSIGTIWLPAVEIDQLATYLGFVTAGLAIALRDPLVNLVAWLYITATRPFGVGDRIELAGLRGDVVGQHPFAFQMLELGSDQSTGRVVSTPNAMVFTHPVINDTLEFSYVWLDLPVVVTFESEWRQLRQLLLEIAQRHVGDNAAKAERALRASTRLMVDYGTLTPCVYVSAVDHGVKASLRCLVGARQRRIARDAIWRDLLTHIESNDALELAYPTQRFYDRKRESEPSSMPPTAGDAPG